MKKFKEQEQKIEPREKAAEFLEGIVSEIESGKISEEVFKTAMDKLNRYRNDIEFTLQNPDKEIPNELLEKSKQAKSKLAEIEDKLKEAFETKES